MSLFINKSKYPDKSKCFGDELKFECCLCIFGIECEREYQKRQNEKKKGK